MPIDNIRKNEDSITLFKDVYQVVQKGPNKVWEQVNNPSVNMNGTGLGFSMKKEVVKPKSALSKYQAIFHSAEYLHLTTPRINDIPEDESEQEMSNLVTHGVTR